MFLSAVVWASLARSESAPASAIREAALQTRRLWSDDEAKGMVEYGLLVVLVSLAALTAATALWKAFRFFSNLVSSSAYSMN